MKSRRLPRPPSELATAKGLARHIKRKSTLRGFPKAVALREIANLIHLIIHQAHRGDEDCGYFLGEFIPILQKQCPKLEQANETFRKTFDRFGSMRLTTAKDSSLRPLIHRIILKVETKRSMADLARHIPAMRRYRNDELSELPDLDPSQDAIDRWTDLVVYPRLRRMRRKLSSHPRIGKLSKAMDENGKFQISLLKPLIRKTVARIAAVPRRYYSSAP